MTEKPESTLRFWLIVVAVVLGLVLLLRSETFHDFLDSSIQWAESVIKAHPIWGAVVFFLFSALSAMLAFASSVVLVPPANLVWGKTVTFLLLWGGWTVGAMAAFGIGRRAGPRLMPRGYKEKLKQYQQYVSTQMKFWMVLVFCLAVPSEIPGYLFGGMKYPFLKFMAAIAIVEAIYALGVIIAGEKLLDAKPGSLVLVVAAMAAVAAAAGFILRQMKKRKPNTTEARGNR